MKQMKAVAVKYDGACSPDFDPETKKFQLKMLLKNQMPE